MLLYGLTRQAASQAIVPSFPAPRPSMHKRSGHRGVLDTLQYVQSCSPTTKICHGNSFSKGKYRAMPIYFVNCSLSTYISSVSKQFLTCDTSALTSLEDLIFSVSTAFMKSSMRGSQFVIVIPLYSFFRCKL